MKRLGWFLLNILQGMALSVWTVICVAFAALLRPLGPDLPLHMARIWSTPLCWIGGVRVEVRQEAPIDWSRPHVFVLNHQSMLDIPVAFRCIPVALRFIAKRSLLFVPFLGLYMKATGMIFVDREKSAKAIASIQKAGLRIRQGASIIAFPEGTRTRDGRIQPFKKGTFMVAIEAQVPIVPMAIHGASDVLPRDSFRVRPGRVRLAIGAPIPTEGLRREDRDELIHKVRSEVIRLHVESGGAGGDDRTSVATRSPADRTARGDPSKRSA